MARILAVGVLTILTAASCGVSGDGEQAPGPTPAPTTVSPTTTETSTTTAVVARTTSTTNPATTTTPPMTEGSTTTASVSTTTSTTNPVSTTSPLETTTTVRPGIDEVGPGLFCRDVASAGYGYREAVEYWHDEGSPLRMDADRNGVPCETVYSAEEVLAYWGGSLPADVTFDTGEWVGRTVELEAEGGGEWDEWVVHDGSRFDLRVAAGGFVVPLDGYPEASGWFVAEGPVDLWAPAERFDVMVWVVDGRDRHGTILAALGLTLTPERPLEYCWQAALLHEGRVVVWIGDSHAWAVDEPPTYFSRIDRRSIECAAG